MDTGTFYGGLLLGIIIGFCIFLHVAKSSNKLSNSIDFGSNKAHEPPKNNKDPINIIELCVQESLISLQEIHSVTDDSKIPELIKQKQHLLTNHLCKLDQIENPQFRNLRKNTIIYIQSVQDFLDTYL